MNKRFKKQSALSATSKIQADLQTAVALHQRGQLIEAEQLYRKILKAAPHHFDATHLLGVVLLQRRQLVEAEHLIARALKINPSDPSALNNRGLTLQELGRFDEALASYDKAIVLKPNYSDALYNRGNTLKELKRYSEALANYDKAIALKPDYYFVFNNRGLTLQELKRFDEALISYDKAIALKPDCAEAFNNQGNALQELRRFDEALAKYDQSIALKPDYATAFNNRGLTLQELKRFDEALVSYDKAIALKPDYAEAFNNQGNAFQELKRFDDALKSYEKALTINPDHRHAFSGLAGSALRICDWTRTTKFVGELKAHVANRRSIILPFTLLGYSSDPALQLKCAQSYIEDKIPIPPPSLRNGTSWCHNKIRVAYLSADFHQHATAFLMAELFELHDRTGFEVLGISFGPDDKSDMRSRLIKSFNQFHEVRLRSDREVAKLVNQLQVDIAVDLKGYTQNSRLGILAHRPAPIQVSYLGYPGTTGTDFMDYVLADRIVLPFDQQPFYTEKIVHLPECYQVNDSQKKISAGATTRHEVGLPERGFVFCCFNNNYKITAPVFEVWLRLLQAIDGSMLWLLRADNSSAETNLRKEAAARGMDPARVIFASPMPLQDHLARYRLADLFLDTLPINAHTTASDALWAGLPLLTCCGQSFAGRVAASLLYAIGLPELVTHGLEEYEALALRLARDASLLANIKAKLACNRDTYPLFNSKRFTRHLEAAYTTMWEIWQRGESPRSFSVTSKPDSEVVPRSIIISAAN